MSENYIIRVYTKDWAGNVDTNVQAAVFGVDDGRYGSEQGLHLFAHYMNANPKIGWDLDGLLEPHPDNDSFYAFDAQMYYSVAQEHGKDGPGSSYVEFYLDKSKTDENFDEFITRLRWLRDNDPEDLVGIVDFKLFYRVVAQTQVEINLD